MTMPIMTAAPLLAVEDLHVDFSTRNGVVNAVRGHASAVRTGATAGQIPASAGESQQQ